MRNKYNTMTVAVSLIIFPSSTLMIMKFLFFLFNNKKKQTKFFSIKKLGTVIYHEKQVKTSFFSFAKLSHSQVIIKIFTYSFLLSFTFIRNDLIVTEIYPFNKRKMKKIQQKNVKTIYYFDPEYNIFQLFCLLSSLSLFVVVF